MGKGKKSTPAVEKRAAPRGKKQASQSTSTATRQKVAHLPTAIVEPDVEVAPELPPIRWLCAECGRVLRPPYECKHCREHPDA
ncbi:MAG: hypothetical protein QOF51_3280 [Chloroflexota bacterium]|nr:hypothetical protein [Chloroflexota bacterium]